MIGENIKRARQAKGLSQEEVAVKLHVVRQTVSKWEKGLSVPDADVLMRLAKFLDVPVSQLLGVEIQPDPAQNLAEELARVNEQLALQIQKERQREQANKKRGLLLLLSFIAMLIALAVKNEILSIVLIGICMLAALVILYRNLALLTSITTDTSRIGVLKATTIFNAIILLLAVAVVILNKAALIQISEDGERLLVMLVVCIVMLFGGFISPKLPFNRHTGLRLPWTVQDEDTWNVAHKIIGCISLPMVLLYAAASLTIQNTDLFAAVTGMSILLWAGIPGLLSYIFFRKKFHRKG